MKKKLIFIFIIFTNILFAQKAKYELQLKKKYLVDFIEVADNGTSVIGTRKNLFSRKSQDFHILRLDENLNVTFNKKVGSPNFIPLTIFSKQHSSEKIISTNGKYFLMGETLIDEKGNVKPYNFFNRNGSPKTGSLESFFSVFGDEYYAFIGRKRGRKYKKKVYSSGDLFIFTRKHEDYSEKTSKLEFPALYFENTDNDEEGKITIVGRKGFGNNFYILAYKTSDKYATQKKTYYILNYDYNGKLISNTKANVELDKVYFLSSGQSRIKLLIDDKNKNFYFYGTYGDKKEKKTYMRAKYKGFYVIKFDKNGNLLWRKQVPINDKYFLKAKAPTYCIINADLYGDKIKVNIIDVDYTKKNWMYFLDNNSGEIQSKYHYSHIKKTNNQDKYTHYFGSKDFKKYVFDFKSFALKQFNPEFQKYLKKQPNTKLSFEGYDLPTGKTLIRQSDTKNNKYTFLIF